MTFNHGVEGSSPSALTMACEPDVPKNQAGRPAPSTACTGAQMSRLHRAFLIALTVCVMGCPSAWADEDDDAALDVLASAAGEVLALGDLCQWDFATRIEKLHRDAAKALRLTPAQQNDLHNRVTAVRRNTFGRFSAAGQARLRGDVCTPQERVRLNEMIAKLSFD